VKNNDVVSLKNNQLREISIPKWTTFRSVIALLMREVATNNARSYGGVLWATVTPLASVIVLTTIFSAGFKSPPIGDVFAMFYATGVVPFTLYGSVAGRIGNAVKENRKMLRYPRISIIDTIFAKLIFVLLNQTIVATLLFSFIFIYWGDTKTIFDLKLFLTAMFSAALLGLGVGTVNAYLFLIFPLWRQFWSIATTPLFILSCIVFSYEQVPQPFDEWIIYNPLVHIVALSRSAFYFGYSDHHVVPLYPICVALALLITGLLLLSQGRARLLSR